MCQLKSMSSSEYIEKNMALFNFAFLICRDFMSDRILSLQTCMKQQYKMGP